MKFDKFYAATMTEALSKIKKTLGSDAIIYAQNKTKDGVEVICGIPGGSPVHEAKINNTINALIDSLDEKEFKTELKWLEVKQQFQLKLRQLKFSFELIKELTESFIIPDDIINTSIHEMIIKILLSKINIQNKECINQHKICALVGPTGIGKSTTIAKLAKRFARRHGAEKLGIISTDFQRIMNKNQFYYFGKLLNIQVEYAKNATELKEAIRFFEDKQLILIDTAGVNHNDNKKIAALFEKLNNETLDIASYLVLPCNLQADVLNAVVKNFKMPHTAGCILTKTDECQSISPSLSIVLMHQLPIAYWCDGQNITKDIHVPSKTQIIKTVFQGEHCEGRHTISVNETAS